MKSEDGDRKNVDFPMKLFILSDVMGDSMRYSSSLCWPGLSIEDISIDRSQKLKMRLI